MIMSSRQFILRQLQPSRSYQLKVSEPNNHSTGNIAELKAAFVEKYKELGGQLINCSVNHIEATIKELIESHSWHKGISSKEFTWQDLPLGSFDDLGYDPDFSITACSGLIASTGSIVIECGPDQSRLASVSCQNHIVIAKNTQIVSHIHQVLKYINGSMSCIISGHSKTADIEKTLVDGAHGPKQLFLILLA